MVNLHAKLGCSIFSFDVNLSEWDLARLTNQPGGALGYFFGWLCATPDSKLIPRSKKNFP